jgi:hypothetical protein
LSSGLRKIRHFTPFFLDVDRLPKIVRNILFLYPLRLVLDIYVSLGKPNKDDPSLLFVGLL